MNKQNLNNKYNKYADEDLSDYYRKPSASAWAAAISAAAAIFVLGGFIKIQQVTEKNNQEIRRELVEMRKNMDDFREKLDNLRDANILSMSMLSGQQRKELPYPDKISEKIEKKSGNLEKKPEQSLFSQTGNEKIQINNQIFPENYAVPAAGAVFYPDYKQQFQTSTIIRPDHVITAVTPDQTRVMIKGGRDMGLIEGQKLNFSRSGRWLGELQAVTISDNVAICDVLKSSESPRIDDIVYAQ